MDEDGDISLLIPGGKWLKEVAVGEHSLKYDSMRSLTHFKGHSVGGFGGSLKNISIGCTSGKVVTADSPAARRRKLSGRPAVHGAHGGRGKAITTLFGKHIASIKCCVTCP